MKHQAELEEKQLAQQEKASKERLKLEAIAKEKAEAEMKTK
jgi:hypothetical protein